MDDSPSRRSVDHGVAAVAAKTAARTSKTFWNWFESHHIDMLLVLSVTLYLTYTVVDWALWFPTETETKMSGVDRAAILGAVLTPWGIMQGLMFKFYVDLKGKNGQAPQPIVIQTQLQPQPGASS
jgi:hypothetical protein